MSIILVLYIYLYTYKKIDNHYVYMPYSNYIYHTITNDKPSYYERSRYNLVKYKERKNQPYYK